MSKQPEKTFDEAMANLKAEFWKVYEPLLTPILRSRWTLPFCALFFCVLSVWATLAGAPFSGASLALLALWAIWLIRRRA
jgi:hypothetical protein